MAIILLLWVLKYILMQLEYFLYFFLLNKSSPSLLERAEMLHHDLHGRRRPTINV